MNALYKACFKALDRIASYDSRKKMLLIVAFGDDNASIVYSANDAAALARKIDCPVYVVGIGEAIQNYKPRYLAEISGGFYRGVFKEELERLPLIFREIFLAQKQYYYVETPRPSKLSDCESVRASLFFETIESKIGGNARYIPKPYAQAIRYQALANFDYKKSNVEEEYLPIINSLAAVLKQNPDYDVELIGHAFREGDDIREIELSKLRAEKVKDKLIELGVNPNQARVRGLGSRKPIYLIPRQSWQEKRNRRVEVRWLDPSLRPYEIDLEIEPSEELARKKVDFWEKKGYKAYYERYIIDGKPAYQVKIWGFKALDEAKTLASELKKKYKIETKVY